MAGHSIGGKKHGQRFKHKSTNWTLSGQETKAGSNNSRQQQLQLQQKQAKQP